MRTEIVKNMSNTEYHAHPGLSNSRLKFLLDCPARYYAEFLDPNKPKKEEKERHFAIGQAVHSLVLEPDRFFKDNFVMPKIDRRTKEGKEMYLHFLSVSKGKNLITEEESNKAHAMANSIFSSVKWLKSVLKDACIEESLFWVDNEHNIQLKSRPDIYTDQFYIDLKTSQSCNQSFYQRSILNYFYHTQAAMAQEALSLLHNMTHSYYMHIVVEEDYPYLTACYILDDEYLKYGKKQFKEAVKTYKTCSDNNEWPAYGSEVKQLYLPNWIQ